MNKQISYWIIACWILFVGCNSNTGHPVPLVSTDITIDFSLPSYNALNGVGGYTYVNGGSKGIVVYRRSQEEFIAWDRHSPADPTGVCEQPLTPQADNFLILEDTCNAASFSMYDGSPVENSDFGLRQFRTLWDGNTGLRIYN